MKPSGLKSGSKGQFPCDMQERRERSNPPLKSVKKDSTKPDKLKCKPLTGKVFYLDIPSNTLSEKIAKDLKELGGKVEEFLSKDINYLISNKKEAKFAALGQVSSVPSPESVCNGGNSSPHPSSRRDKTEGSTFKLADTVRMSRGKSLVEKAIKDQELIPSDIKNYIDQKKKDLFLVKKSSTEINNVEKGSADQKVKSKLKNPFLKIEDRRCRYRPFYLQLSSFPVVNYSNPRPCSPFDVEKKNACGQKQIHNKHRNPANSDREKRTVQVPPKHKRKKGYCECCMKKYEDLHAHVESEQHQTFAKSSQYQVVDDIISKFSCDFLELRESTPKVKRRKCNILPFLPSPPHLLSEAAGCRKGDSSSDCGSPRLELRRKTRWEELEASEIQQDTQCSKSSRRERKPAAHNAALRRWRGGASPASSSSSLAVGAPFFSLSQIAL
ncbi:protein DBF4A-like [Crotalus adamanteus]|uniref:Protein DBF4 homolog A n=1 Tax=Crotalus adamanteus TaxID=8729 RepID=A0AAW1B2S3_CROAD